MFGFGFVGTLDGFCGLEGGGKLPLLKGITMGCRLR